MNILRNTAQKKVKFYANDTINNLMNTTFNLETHIVNIHSACFRIECSVYQIMKCIALHKNALFLCCVSEYIHIITLTKYDPCSLQYMFQL